MHFMQWGLKSVNNILMYMFINRKLQEQHLGSAKSHKKYIKNFGGKLIVQQTFQDSRGWEDIIVMKLWENGSELAGDRKWLRIMSSDELW